MVDMSAFIAPKSDQLNADDLIGGPRTIQVSRVSANEGSAEQPVNLYFDGDGGKPYRPCKSMRRVMVHVWGKDANAYPGRSMTIYRDPGVQFGGMQVGGIRISHMSGIKEPVTLALTATRASRKPYKVMPLADDTPKPAPQDRATQVYEALLAKVEGAGTLAGLQAVVNDEKATMQRGWMQANRPEMAADITAAIDARLAALTPPDDEPPADGLELPA
jgi:hypothetical protein